MYIGILKPFDMLPIEMIEIVDTIYPIVKNKSVKNWPTRLCNSLLDIDLTDDPITTQ